MQKKEVEKLLGLKKSYIDYLIREKWVLPQKKGQFYNFSEEDIERIKLLRVLKSLHVSEKDVKRWNKQEVRFDDILAVTETKLNDEVKKLLGALEMIQELRTCCTTSQTIPVDYYWEKIRFSKDKDSKEFMGKFELEDISDWAELYVNTERIVKCPYCRKENSIDVKEYIYDEIMKERANGGYNYGYGAGSGNYSYGNNSYGNQSYGNGRYQQYNNMNPEMQAAFNFINNRRYQDAINVLNRMNDRTAQWYYASSMANAGVGNNVLARDYAAQAVNMDPNNPQYRELMNQLNWGAQRYNSNPFGQGYGNRNSSPCGTGNMCCDLWIADSLCECMGGDLCPCI